MLQLYVVYEKHPLNIKTQIQSKWVGRKVYHANSKHKKSGGDKLLTTK